MSASIVPQEHALGIEPVAPRHASTTDEDVGGAVAVEIRRHHARAADGDGRNRADRLSEISLAVVQIQAILEWRRALRELAAAGGDIQIDVTIAIGIEERGADVLAAAVRREQLPIAFHQAHWRPLD